MTTTKSEQTPNYDVVVVGCGGWGLAVLKALQALGFNVLGLERGEICHNLTTYMPGMTVHSPLSYIVLDPDDPLLAAKGDDYHCTIEELIESYLAFADKYKLPIQTHTPLQHITGSQGSFVLTAHQGGRDVQYRAKFVVLATGAYDHPNLLDIPGAKDPSVHHYFAQWRHIRDQRLLFIGGGFSSADGIAALCACNQVLWVTNKKLAAIEQMLDDQKTKWGQPDAEIINTEILPQSQVLSLTAKTAQIQTANGARRWPFDQCFMLLGHRPDETLLRRLLGDDASYDEDTFAARRPGIYLVGALSEKNLEHIGLTNKLCPGNQGVRHITKIVDAIKNQLQQS